MNSGGYRWQFEVPGASLQTYALDATDSGGYQVRKLFDLVVTNVAPIANDDVYSVREQKTLLGNVLDNDANYNDHPPCPGGRASHGTLTLQADGSFHYTSRQVFWATTRSPTG